MIDLSRTSIASQNSECIHGYGAVFKVKGLHCPINFMYTQIKYIRFITQYRYLHFALASWNTKVMLYINCLYIFYVSFEGENN